MEICLSIQVWSCDIIVDWADPQEEPDEGTMSKVKVLYVRNLTQEISEEKLKVIKDFIGCLNFTHEKYFTGALWELRQSGAR